jgi:N4-(beta-N-acetylglucosaminyl)-L-asparaginase
MIMDGTNMAVGSVGAIKRIQHAISVARKVMDHTFHTLLVGESATQFAVKHGFKEMSLSTPKSADMWSKWMVTKSPDYIKHEFLAANAKHDRYGHDTIGMVAIDKNG